MGSIGCLGTLLVIPLSQPQFSYLYNGYVRTSVGNNSDGCYKLSVEPKKPGTKGHLQYDSIYIVGAQSRPPQNMPQRHIDYFELKLF